MRECTYARSYVYICELVRSVVLKQPDSEQQVTIGGKRSWPNIFAADSETNSVMADATKRPMTSIRKQGEVQLVL